MRPLLLAVSALACFVIAGLTGYRMGIGRGAETMAELAQGNSTHQSFWELSHGLALSDPRESASARKHGEALMRGSLLALGQLRGSLEYRTCNAHERRWLQQAAGRVGTLSLDADSAQKVREGLRYCEGAH